MSISPIEKRNDLVLRIMSSNIWGNCKDDCPIADRDDNLAVIYERYLPDIVGMQECSPKSRAESPNIMDLVSDKYEEIPTNPTNEHKNNYTPIIYLRDKFAVLDKGWHYFSGLNDRGSKSITWAVFERRNDGARFIVMNTHYYWTQDEPGRAARVGNTAELLDLFGRLTKLYPYPVFFTGDFNCRTCEAPIKAILEFGIREPRDEIENSSPYTSHHDYPTYDPKSDSYHTPIMPDLARENSIDHIFTHGKISTLFYEVVTDFESLLATDHCPIFIDAVI